MQPHLNSFTLRNAALHSSILELLLYSGLRHGSRALKYNLHTLLSTVSSDSATPVQHGPAASSAAWWMHEKTGDRIPWGDTKNLYFYSSDWRRGLWGAVLSD